MLEHRKKQGAITGMYLQQKRQKSDLVNIKDYIPDVFVDLKYATEDNFTGHRVYDFSERATRHHADWNPEAAQNVQLVENLLVECGFRAYEGEWWHYVDLDVYPVEEKLK